MENQDTNPTPEEAAHAEETHRHDREAGGFCRLEDLLPVPCGELRRLQVLALRVAAGLNQPTHRLDQGVQPVEPLVGT